jgi:hypothetical protein
MRPPEIASMVLFADSDAARGLHGDMIVADVGWTSHRAEVLRRRRMAPGSPDDAQRYDSSRPQSRPVSAASDRFSWRRQSVRPRVGVLNQEPGQLLRAGLDVSGWAHERD